MQKVVAEKLTQEWVIKRLPFRPNDANKGIFGKILVVAGSENYPGAAYLACAACYRVGAGLVTLVTEPEVKIIVSRKLPEVTFLSFDKVFDELNKYDVLLIGPGLGRSSRMAAFIKQLLGYRLPKTIIDGDGLNILSKTEQWWEKLQGEIIFTPHPKEMSRLAGLSVQKIQANRINVAQYFAKKWNKIIVLKGANTVIAPPLGGVQVSPFANPILATAGTGDVLSGIIAGMLAQGLDCFKGSCVGVYIHGLAGELVGKKIGKAGMLASDLLPMLPHVIKDLV